MVTFLGDVTWKQASEPVWSTDAFGFDTARLPFRGAVTLKADFEATLVDFAVLAGFPRMYLMGYSDDGQQVFPTIECNFVGVRGALPPLKIVNSTVLQTVSTSVEVTGDDGPETATMEAMYYTSRTNYRWIMDLVPPVTPPYTLVQNPANIQPVSYRISGSGSGVGTVDYSTFVSLLNNLTVATQVTDYTREVMVPGKLWACECSVDQVLIG